MNKLYKVLQVSPETVLDKMSKTANDKSYLYFINSKINFSLTFKQWHLLSGFTFENREIIWSYISKIGIPI